MRKIGLLLLSAVILLQTAYAQEHSFQWKSIPVDGSRTGVSVPSTENVNEALGVFKGKTYIAPNGAKFKKKSATAKAAALMIEAQPAMAYVKEVVGTSTRRMEKRSPESELSNWIVDTIMDGVEQETGRKVDVGITNFGGIRADMPKGTVFYEDIQSMLPFNNTVCLVTMTGAELTSIFEGMAARSMQAVGGVKVVVKDRKLETLLVNGEEVDPEKVYGVATISFLLEGGDGLAIAKNAIEVVDTGINVFDSVIKHVYALREQGKPIEYEVDGRVTVINTNPERFRP